MLGPLVERRQTGSLASTASVGLQHFARSLFPLMPAKSILHAFTLKRCEERGVAAAMAAPVIRHMERCQEIVAVLLIVWSAGDGLVSVS